MRKRSGKSEDVEERLKKILLAPNLGLEDFKSTNGWLERWKIHNSINFKKQHGKRKDVDDLNVKRWT
ncbi:hypothetical protein HZS_230 [Henneguya salminicola]|nr:hypothetical protein HZS_230 [Henneguya salminicola]